MATMMRALAVLTVLSALVAPAPVPTDADVGLPEQWSALLGSGHAGNQETLRALILAAGLRGLLDAYSPDFGLGADAASLPPELAAALAAPPEQRAEALRAAIIGRSLRGFLNAFAVPEPSPEPTGPVVSNGGFEEFDVLGLPVDWQILGTATSTSDAYEGERAILLTRRAGEPGETGLNRAWQPNSGEQGTMLSQLKGGIRFWYKAPAASSDAHLYFHVIPMSNKPIEDTGKPRATFEVPAEHIGDGNWHQGVLAYDFTDSAAVKWVHLSPRILGTSAEWIIDAVEWVESVGPLLAHPQLEVLPNRAIVRLRISNIGDAPVRGVRVSVSAPPGAELVPVGEIALPAELAPRQVAFLQWSLEGEIRGGARVAASLSCDDDSVAPVQGSLVLRPEVRCFSLEAEHAVLAVGEETPVRLSAFNYGLAAAEDVSLDIALPPQLELVGDLPPRSAIPGLGWAEHVFRVRAIAQSPSATITGKARWRDNTWDVQTTLVVGALPGPETAMLESGDLRLVVPKSEWGAGPCRIQVWRGAWTDAGWLPHLGRVVFRNSRGADETIAFPAAASRFGRGLSFIAAVEDSDGGRWEAEASFVPGPSRSLVRAAYKVRCDKPRRVRAYEGPVVFADTIGEDALFPGLEWLEWDEVSSSTLDIALDHPDQVRFVPHPQKITIPFMAVSDGRTTLGLLWDARRAWDGANDRPSAIFSCPGYLDGHRAATMGLMAPNALGGWLKENERLASEPYALPAGRWLTLDAMLFGSGDSATALDALDAWLDTYGIIEPARPPRGGWIEEIEFSARAYMESLYDPDEGLWWSSKGAGPLLSPKGSPSPHYEWDLRRAAVITGNDELRELYSEWADKIHAITGVPPGGWDGGFEYGDATGWLHMLLGAAPGLMTAQLPDGGWAFEADRVGSGVFEGFGYWYLGNDGEVELGTCAQPASQLLRLAKVTGDSRAYDAGVRALELMERFRVPRAAQVWEVPVHTPDVLASAHAVIAYLEAYECDGNPRWLDRAVYWARTGLPFIYLWDDPAQPFLRYASIPVFGATLFQGSWFGRPVQWNGLDYAEALWQLARHDDSRPWTRIAEGIVVSAMHQQAASGDDIALWPDSIGAIGGDKSAWVFAPVMVNRGTYRLLGRDAVPRTISLGTGAERIRVTALGDSLRSASWDGGDVQVDLEFAPRGRGSVLITNTTEPAEVLLDGQPLPRGRDWPGWSYDLALAALAVRVPDDGPHSIKLRGVSWASGAVTPETVTDIAFEFDTGTEGWLPLNAVQNFRAEDGALRFAVSDVDPFIGRSALLVEGRKGDILAVRMRTECPGGAQVYWGTESAPGYAEARVINFPISSDGDWHEYRIAVGDHPQWSGHSIVSLRLDPCALGPGEGSIDWVRLERAQ